MLKAQDLTIERNWGAWEIYALINGREQTRRYYGHTKPEAVRSFLRELGSKAVTV